MEKQNKIAAATLSIGNLGQLVASSDASTVVQVIEAIRTDMGTIHNIIITAENVTTALSEDLAKSKDTVDKYALENEKVKSQLRDTVINHEREVANLKTDMKLV